MTTTIHDLPQDRLPSSVRATWTDLLSLNSDLNSLVGWPGFHVGQPIDDLFTRVVLPKGWVTSPSDHRMWSQLKDERGFVRASIFCDPLVTARMFVHCRYEIQAPVETFLHGVPVWCVNVVDSCSERATIFCSTPFPRMDNTALLAATALAREWLTLNFPQYRDPMAYWNNLK